MAFSAKRYFSRRYAPAWLVLAAGLSASGLLGWKLHEAALQLDKQRLERIAKLVHDYIEARTEKTEMLLFQAQDYFGTQDELTRVRFLNWCDKHAIPRDQAWVHGLAFYTNKNTAMWRSELPANPADWTSQECQKFVDWAARTPVKLEQALKYSPRIQKWPTNYLWEWSFLPEKNRVYSHPSDCIGMNSPRTTGFQPVMIYPSNGVEYGAALVLPLYLANREELYKGPLAQKSVVDKRVFNWNLCRGILIAPIDYKDIVSRIWEKYPQETGIEIYASNEPSSETWLNPNGGKPRAVDPTFAPYLATIKPWRMYGRSWAVFLYTLPQFERESPRRWAWVAGVAGVGLTLLASGLVGVALRARERQELMTDQIREARDALSAAQQERDKFSRDLHDGAIQSLYAIQLGLSHTAQELEADPANVRRQMSTVGGELDTVIAELRRFVTAEPGADKPVELSSVLSAVVQRAGAGPATKIELHCDPGVSARLSGAQGVQLANIAREALSNSLRHSKPRRVEIALRADSGTVWLEVADDGSGFDPQAPPRRGAGLASMEARVQEMGGTLEIQSASGLGTRVMVRVGVEGNGTEV